MKETHLIDWNDPRTWRFGLWQLLAALTVNALACSVMVADLPLEVRGLGLCMLVFSIGAGTILVGAACGRLDSLPARIAGEVAMSIGFGLGALAVVVAFTIGLHLSLYAAYSLAA